MGLFSSSRNCLPIACFISCLFEKHFLAHPRKALHLPAEILRLIKFYYFRISDHFSIRRSTILLSLLTLLFTALCLLLHAEFLPVLVLSKGILEKRIFHCFLFFLSLHSAYSYFSRFLYGLVWRPDTVVTGFVVLPNEESFWYRNNIFWWT